MKTEDGNTQLVDVEPSKSFYIAPCLKQACGERSYNYNLLKGGAFIVVGILWILDVCAVIHMYCWPGVIALALALALALFLSSPVFWVDQYI